MASLEAFVIQAVSLTDTEELSKQDPYFVLIIGAERWRGKTDTDGGKHPKWNERKSFNVDPSVNDCAIEVWNSNTLTSDTFIGGARFNLSQVKSQGTAELRLPLTNTKGHNAGEIQMVLTWRAGQAGAPYASASAAETRRGESSERMYAAYPPTAPYMYPPPAGYPTAPPAGYPTVPPAGYPPPVAPGGYVYPAAAPPGYPVAGAYVPPYVPPPVVPSASYNPYAVAGAAAVGGAVVGYGAGTMAHHHHVGYGVPVVYGGKWKGKWKRGFGKWKRGFGKWKRGVGKWKRRKWF